jgi:large subunit ribosomal protein L35
MKNKLKTKKAAAKRFKITGTGKIMRYKPGRRHLLGQKPANKMRSKKGTAIISSTETNTIKTLLPYA